MEDSQTPNQSPITKPKQSKTALVVTLIIAALAVAGVAALIIANPSSAPDNDQAESAGSTSNNDADHDTATTTDPSTPGDTGSTAETAKITFTSSGFSPSTITVKKGTVVTVTNNSSSDVQFSSDDHPTHREDPEINMETLAPGESGTFIAKTVGTHGFHDHIDDSKTGTLIVTE